MVRILNNKDLTPEVLESLSWDTVQWIYNGLDCCLTHEIFTKVYEDSDDVTKATYEFSKQLAVPTFEMFLRGTRVDHARRQKVLAMFSKQQVKLEKNFKLMVHEGIGYPGTSFNYRSPLQVKKLFYEALGLKEVKARNSSGIWAPAVNREAIETLAQYFIATPLCSHLLKLRELDKKISFLSTKLDKDKRLRTSYNVAGTNTGRLASSTSDFDTGTNNQNIDRHLRSTLIADPGYKFCNIDLEQADARNVGAKIWNLFHASHGEEYAGAYLNACESGDLHTFVSQMAYPNLSWTADLGQNKAIADDKSNYAYREFTYRDMSKRLGHGTNFYGTPRTMAMHTKVPFKIINEFQENYFATFPAIGQHGKEIGENNWHRSVLDALENEGSITTLLGRRRNFYGNTSDAATLREAIAYEPQSLTGDEIDIGIIRLWQWGKVRLQIQVHDSILFQYRAEDEEWIVPKALELLTVKIPLVADRDFFVPTEAKIGWNWGDKAKDNEHGLIKWKGPGLDLRKRPIYKKVYNVPSLHFLKESI